MRQKPTFLALTLNSHWPSLGCLKIKLDLTPSHFKLFALIQDMVEILTYALIWLRAMFPKKLIHK